MNLDVLKGSLKSRSMWLGVLVAVLPYVDPLIGKITELNPVTGAVIGAAIMITRAVTNKSLAEKGSIQS